LFFKFIEFIKRRNNYYKRFDYLPNSDAYNSQIVKDGILVKKDFFTNSDIDSLLSKIEEHFPDAKPLVADLPNPDLRWRVYQLDKELPGTDIFFENRQINETVSGFLGPQTRCSRKALAMKNVFNRHKEGPTEFYHFDDWQHRFKVMIYLDDVNRDNSPFCYLKGSHRKSVWKVWQDFLFYRGFDRTQPTGGGNTNWVATWLDHQLVRLKKFYGWREMIVTGKRGTVILFDSRGLHRGLPLVRGHRRVLIQHFRVTDHDGELKRWRHRAKVDQA
jgi:hypothetical protein